jgi:hypothetical protein
VRDARSAELAAERVGARLGVALVGEELAAGEIVEERLDLARVFRVRRELARELGAGVLSPGEQRDRAAA